jgi:hypothetical protein
MLARPLSLAALALLTAVLAGCGGTEKDKQAAGKPCAQAPAALATAPSLPKGFPTPTGVVYTGQAAKGPTTIVTGHMDSEIDPAYSAWKGAFVAPWSVTKSEHENVDAEVNFAGSGTTGQVKLLQVCKDRTNVTITVRPA